MAEPKHCGECRIEGHYKNNAAECPLFNIGNSIVACEYDISAFRIRSGPKQGHLNVTAPKKVAHHVVVFKTTDDNITREIGFGQKGIEMKSPGTYHGDRGEQLRRYVRTNLQIGATKQQLDEVVAEMKAAGWKKENYCCLHKNCMDFCRDFLGRLFQKVEGQPLPAMPAEFKQYTFNAINGILVAVRFVAGQMGHEGPHKCLAF